MLRSRFEVPVGREVGLVFELPMPVSTRVRVVRCEPVDVALPGAAVWRRQDFALGVHFIDHNHELAAAVRSLSKQTGKPILVATDLALAVLGVALARPLEEASR